MSLLLLEDFSVNEGLDEQQIIERYTTILAPAIAQRSQQVKATSTSKPISSRNSRGGGVDNSDADDDDINGSGSDEEDEDLLTRGEF